jgi:hypothetical protein
MLPFRSEKYVFLEYYLGWDLDRASEEKKLHPIKIIRKEPKKKRRKKAKK